MKKILSLLFIAIILCACTTVKYAKDTRGSGVYTEQCNEVVVNSLRNAIGLRDLHGIRATQQIYTERAVDNNGYTRLAEVNLDLISQEDVYVDKVVHIVKNGTTWIYLKGMDTWGFYEEYYAVADECNDEIYFVEPGDVIHTHSMENCQIMDCRILEKAPQAILEEAE